MKTYKLIFALALSASFAAASGQTPTSSRTPAAASAPTAIPALVPFSGIAVGSDGKPLAGEAPITFIIYKDEAGGEALWAESQTAAVDSTGQYKVQLGAANPNGLPSDLFASGEARWLEVQIAGQTPQARILLASVPYALKAADSATLGGLPASAFALAGTKLATINPIPAGISPNATSTVTTTGGTTNKIAKFSGSSTIVNSIVYDNGTDVGIGTTAPTATLTVAGTVAVNGSTTQNGQFQMSPGGTATAKAGYGSQPLKFNGSAYNSSTKAVVSPRFQMEAEVTGNDTSAPNGTLNLLASSGTPALAETGLYFNTNGTIHFATDQTFPGTGTGDGTITGVGAGTGLTGGGTSGKVTLNLNTALIPTLAANNTFTGPTTFLPSIYEKTDVNIDSTNANPGNISPGLRFGSASGEGMSSKRTEGGNQYGLDLYTGYSSRMSINASGQVAIGTGATFPAMAQLQVQSASGVGVQGSSTSGVGGEFFGGAGDWGLMSTGSSTTSTYGGGGGVLYGGDANVSGDGVDGVAGEGGIEGGNGVGGQGGYSDQHPGPGGSFVGGDSDSVTGGEGIYATSSGSSGSYGPAAVLDGDVNVTGTLSAAVKNFQIDHPLDPANKYLNHTSVESSEMMNIYSGNVTTDELGLATVQLPGWFEKENGDFRYQLTIVGRKAQAWISQEIKDGKFQIASDATNTKVSWQVTGVRQDAYAKAHPLVVEQAKAANERGFYLHPELYGQPRQKQTAWGRHPAMMSRMQAERDSQRSHAPSTQHKAPKSTLVGIPKADDKIDATPTIVAVEAAKTAASMR